MKEVVKNRQLKIELKIKIYKDNEILKEQTRIICYHNSYIP